MKKSSVSDHSIMSNDDDECDSNVASQSDVASFLQAQAAKNTGLTSNIDEDQAATSLLSNALRPTRNSYLSQSCFASIAPQLTSSDDLCSLKWLVNFDLTQTISSKSSTEKIRQSTPSDQERFDQFAEQLESAINTPSTDKPMIVWVCEAICYQRDDPETPWSLTLKQFHDYFQANLPLVVKKRHWKHLLKQTLLMHPCFVQKKDETVKSRLLWTVDAHYRPLLTRAYANRAALTSKKYVESLV